jgi:hypothetical protein
VTYLIFNFQIGGQDRETSTREGFAMLAEKFFLVLETLRSHDVRADGSQIVVSRTPHVPVRLPSPK